MKITFLGHAGLFAETAHGSVLCDPWFTPAYFGSWFPFPSNECVDPAAIAAPTYLYVSHLHHDHFDPDFLRDHVSKDTTVLLPDYPLGLLEGALRDLGFHRFVRTRNWEPVRLDGLTVTIASLVAPTDGPIGDSGLILDDGEVRILDQNDSRPVDLDRLAAMGPYQVHFLQFSGAIWYPAVYDFPPQMLRALGEQKRRNGMARALRYIQAVGAETVVPSAGPPCFLDDGLFELNDFDRDPANAFPDQAAFLDYLEAEGVDRGQLVVPGTRIDVGPGGSTVDHPMPEAEIAAIFAEKRDYLCRYRERQQPRLRELRASWQPLGADLLSTLREWFEPLLERADITCAAIDGVVVMDLGDEAIAIDFRRRRVEPWDGDDWSYHFRFDRALVEHCVHQRSEDWINELFLSCRFRARRRGPFNEYVYNFFKCLSMERLQYVEGWYAEQAPADQFWETHGYRIQRRCPHLKADLTRFAEIEDGILTCTLHGWQFELATGRCITSDDRRLYSIPVGAVDEVVAPPSAPPGATVRPQCDHCSYSPETGRDAGLVPPRPAQ